MPKTPKPPKVWTPKQSARLADPGYYLEFYGDTSILKNPAYCSCIICIGKGKCQYNRINTYSPAKPGQWVTLLWSCAPTKNIIAACSSLPPTERGIRYVYFPSYELMEEFFKTHGLRSDGVMPDKATVDV